jgi:hypothetical protein
MLNLGLWSCAEGSAVGSRVGLFPHAGDRHLPLACQQTGSTGKGRKGRDESELLLSLTDALGVLIRGEGGSQPSGRASSTG